MKTTDTLIIGAGQAGLAMSRCLTDRGVEHVLLERGRVAQRWTERWDSLRLLSPNWMTRLPGWSYRGSDPNGYMGRDDIVNYLTDYAQSFKAPVEENTTVLYVDRWADDWRVITERETWLARNVVIATGNCDVANVPPMAKNLAPEIAQVTALDYRNPDQLPPGGVLVVGASASGVQLAEELRRAGRDVVLSVGRHSRLPRTYRGKDILYWLDRIGSFRRPLSDMPDRQEAKNEPSLQLVGREDMTTIDLAVLAKQGVRLAGRLTDAEGNVVRFADDLERTTAEATENLTRILERIDRHILSHGWSRELPETEPIAPVPVEGAPLDLILRSGGIGTVLWATGYKRSYSWLHAPVLDENGEIRHERGRTPAPGLYVLGLQFMIRRNSSFIDGVGRDAEEIAAEIATRQVVTKKSLHEAA